MASTKTTIPKISDKVDRELAESLLAANKSANIKAARKQLAIALESHVRRTKALSLKERRRNLAALSDLGRELYKRMNRADQYTAKVLTKVALEYRLEDRDELTQLLWDLTFETGVYARTLTVRIKTQPKTRPDLRMLVLDAAAIFENICKVNFKKHKHSPFVRNADLRWLPADPAIAGVRYVEMVVRDVLGVAPSPAEMRTMLRWAREQLDRRRRVKKKWGRVLRAESEGPISLPAF